ncbi:MAG: hypothetical protein L0216_16995 [Planctomycetales bacterium]|nr:hypothetical protein [Planctomycetales bacterium]
MRRLAAGIVLAAGAVGLAAWGARRPVGARPLAGPPVEPDDCVECHRHEVDLWRSSWHSKSVRPARKDTVSMPVPGVAKFGPDPHRHAVFERDGRLLMGAAEADGTVRDQPVDFVIGGCRLEMYITLHGADRRPQVLPAMYTLRESRFVPYWNLYPAREPDRVEPSPVPPGDPIFYWSELPRTFVGSQTLCYRCHSILTKKSYDPDSGVYSVDWGRTDQLGVPCAACHGDSAAHVASARRKDPEPLPPPLDPDPRPGDWVASTDACARCHVQGDSISLDYVPGGQFQDQWMMSVLDETVQFHTDGRWRESAYTMNAHAMSECYRQGHMTCRSCHDVHGDGDVEGTRRLTFAACNRCHLTQARTCREHPRARPGPASHGKLPDCLSCHMPEIPIERGHGRVADHRVSVADPALTRLLGIPNACADCHRDQAEDVLWAEAALARWGAKERPSRRRAVVLALGIEKDPRRRRGMSSEAMGALLGAAGLSGEPEPAVADALRRLLADPRTPWPQAATAGRLLANFPSAETIRALAASAQGAEHADVRAGATFGLFGMIAPRRDVSPDSRAEALAAVRAALRDRRRIVRVMAAAALAFCGDPEDRPPAVPVIEEVASAIPDLFQMRLVLAFAYEQMGRLEEARREHERLCRIRPRDPEPQAARAEFEKRHPR